MFDPKPYFPTTSFDDWQNLQWRLGLVWFLRIESAVQRHSEDRNYHY